MKRLPAEWEPQQLVFFSFPRRDGDWGAVLDAASRDMINAANQVNEVCPVVMVVGDTEHFAAYASAFAGEVVRLPTDDCWIRDSGPITIWEGEPTTLDFTFNGWGGKFDARKDNALPKQINEAFFPGRAYRRIDVVLEGGSIESDGAGTILTTTRCLLAEGRNGYTDRQQAEAMLQKTLGARRVIWLDHGELEGDDTDAHIDTVARFLDQDTIAFVGPPPSDDPQHRDFQNLKNQIEEFSDEYKLVELPWAGLVESESDGHILPASYANFLISNGVLFLPAYGLENDALAVQILQENTNYDIRPVDCRAFVEQHGALHCLTMQVPAF